MCKNKNQENYLMHMKKQEEMLNDMVILKFHYILKMTNILLKQKIIIIRFYQKKLKIKNIILVILFIYFVSSNLLKIVVPSLAER